MQLGAVTSAVQLMDLGLKKRAASNYKSAVCANKNRKKFAASCRIKRKLILLINASAEKKSDLLLMKKSIYKNSRYKKKANQGIADKKGFWDRV